MARGLWWGDLWEAGLPGQQVQSPQVGLWHSTRHSEMWVSLLLNGVYAECLNVDTTARCEGQKVASVDTVSDHYLATLWNDLQWGRPDKEHSRALTRSGLSSDPNTGST